MDLFVPRRPLKPSRREKKKIKKQNLTVASANIAIRVVRAFNVPVREGAVTSTPNLQPSTTLTHSMRNQENFNEDPIQVNEAEELDYSEDGRTMTALKVHKILLFFFFSVLRIPSLNALVWSSPY